MMAIEFNPSVFNISSKLLKSLKKAINKNDVTTEATYITVNFRDGSYNSEDGGYHPVEIALQKDQKGGCWSLLYITDFCYYGFPFAELCKELDFDFSTTMFSAAYSSPRPITDPSVHEMFKLWQSNFLSYLEFGAFDQIKVSAE